MGALFKIKKR